LRCLLIYDCSSIFEDDLKDKNFEQLVQELKKEREATPEEYIPVIKILTFLIGLQAIKDIGGSLSLAVASSLTKFLTGSIHGRSIVVSFVEEILARPLILSILFSLSAFLAYILLKTKESLNKRDVFIAITLAFLISFGIACVLSPACNVGILLRNKTLWFIFVLTIAGYVSEYKYRKGHYKTVLNMMLKRKRDKVLDFVIQKLADLAVSIREKQIELWKEILEIVNEEKEKLAIEVKQEIPTKISRISKILNKHKDIGPLEIDFESETQKFYNNLKSFNLGKLYVIKERVITEIPPEILSPVIQGEEKKTGIVQMIGDEMKEIENSIKSGLEKLSIESFLQIEGNRIVNLNQRKLETEPYPFWSVSKKNNLYSRAYIGRPASLSEKVHNIIYNYLVLDIPNRFDIHYIKESKETFTTPTEYNSDKNTLAIIYYRYGQVGFGDFLSRRMWKEKFSKLGIERDGNKEKINNSSEQSK